ncbi:hypothetical protein FAI40_00085 [Acetobacteraceae bacterium]|nr:hypothetical protein FAI40_00085 [Acetobacteraceae bacterium]
MPSLAIASPQISPEEFLVNTALKDGKIFFQNSMQYPRGLLLQLKLARGIMFCPKLKVKSVVFAKTLKGKCLLLARDSRNSWSAPAFYMITQRHMDVLNLKETDHLIFFIMTQKALEGFLDKEFTFEKKKEISSTLIKNEGQFLSKDVDFLIVNLKDKSSKKDILSQLKISSDDSANKAYYGKNLNPIDILSSMRANNNQADSLRQFLTNILR